MAAKRNRGKLTKEDLREDEVISWVAHAVKWVTGNQTKAFLIAGAVIVAVVLGILVKGVFSSRANSRINDFTAASYYYAQGFYKVAAEKYGMIHNKYGKTSEGRLSLYFEADSYFRLKDYKSALNLYEKFYSENKETLPAATQISLIDSANCLLNLGEKDKAMARLGEYLKAYPKGFLSLDAQYIKAVILTDAKKYADAKKILQKLKDTAYSDYAAALLTQINNEL